MPDKILIGVFAAACFLSGAEAAAGCKRDYLRTVGPAALRLLVPTPPSVTVPLPPLPMSDVPTGESGMPAASASTAAPAVSMSPIPSATAQPLPVLPGDEAQIAEAPQLPTGPAWTPEMLLRFFDPQWTGSQTMVLQVPVSFVPPMAPNSSRALYTVSP